jgi:UDP-sugar transporter A1/2/3
MVFISGYSAIYLEFILKDGEKISLWERNFQLSFYSVVLLSFFIVYEMNYSHPTSDANNKKNGKLSKTMSNESKFQLFKGWSEFTVLIAVTQAVGGILFGATLKYADAILKTIATSGSIVLSAVLGYALLGEILDIFVTLGCLSTILAIFNYTLE